ncbi:hypothetical protein Pa222_006 [Pseudomonas virus Pa222]|nr:hypothetical protein Pa222_006 [Pseudomonas virus Pa222]
MLHLVAIQLGSYWVYQAQRRHVNDVASLEIENGNLVRFTLHLDASEFADHVHIPIDEKGLGLNQRTEGYAVAGPHLDIHGTTSRCKRDAVQDRGQDEENHPRYQQQPIGT